MVCLTASTFALYDFFVAVAPGVMTQQLIASFQLTTTDLGWLGASFFYAYAMMQIPSGWMLDRYGARKMLVYYSLLSAIGLLLFALTQDFTVALIARFLSGTGVCIGFLASYNLASHWLHHRYFSSIAAMLHVIGVAGAILAQGPMAMIVNQFGWRQSTLILVVFTLLLALLYGVVVRNGKQIDHKKGITFKQAMRYCLKNKQVKWIALVGFVSWLPVSIIGSLWGVPYLMEIYHIDNVAASNICSLFWLGSAVGGFILCGFSEKLGVRRLPLQVGFIIAMVSAVIIIAAPHSSRLLMIVALSALGMSVTIQTITFSLIKENVDIIYFTAASGLNNAGSMMSSALGQALVGILLDWHRLSRGELSLHYIVNDYQFALLVIPFASIVGWLIVTFKIRETYCLSLENAHVSNNPLESNYQTN